MRKSFDGLCGLVVNELGRDPLSGDVYVFINRKKDRIKLLIWEASGFWLLYHQLEAGRFQLPGAENANEIVIGYDELILLLEGIELNSIRRRKRYRGLKKSA
jgi:transposase